MATKTKTAAALQRGKAQGGKAQGGKAQGDQARGGTAADGKAEGGKVLTERQYDRLLGEIANIIEGARLRAEQEAANVLVAAYHRVGKRIEREKVTDRAGYGDHLLGTLAGDLGIDQRTLERACHFSRLYSVAPKLGLTWAHYRELMKLKDPAEREFYETLAARDHLSSTALVRAIDADAYSAREPPSLPPHTKLKRPEPSSFVYAVDVVRVVDGDTLLVDIDLGFRITTRVRLRLAHVDSASPKTAKGRAATHFVVTELARAHSVAAQTEWPDLHGRYVSHVFYSKRALSPAETAAKGSYLSEKLLEKGHASPA